MFFRGYYYKSIWTFIKEWWFTIALIGSAGVMIVAVIAVAVK